MQNNNQCHGGTNFDFMSSADIINQAKLIIYNLYLSQGMQYIWGMLMTKL